MFSKKRAEPNIEAMRDTAHRNGRTLFDHGGDDIDKAYRMVSNPERDNLIDVFKPGAVTPAYNIVVFAPLSEQGDMTFRCSCPWWRTENQRASRSKSGLARNEVPTTAGWCKHTLGLERLLAQATDVVRLVDAVWLHAQKTYRLEQAASAFVPNGTDGGNESLRIVCSFGTNERIDDWENAPIDAYGMHFVPFSHLVGNNFVVPVQTQPLWEQGGTAIWLS